MNIKDRLRAIRKPLPRFPPHVEIETTNICNLRCINCPSKNMKRKKGIMSRQLFKKIIEECSEYQGKELKKISLHVFGEPLCNPEIMDYIGYAKRKCTDAIISMSTNVTLLKGDISKYLWFSGLDELFLSIDGATKETYEKYRNGAKFETTKNNIIGFLKHNSAGSKMQVYIQAIQFEDVAKEMEQFENTWRPYLRNNVRLFYKKETKSFAKPLPEEIRLPTKPYCWRLNDLFMVYWDGKCTACCHDVNGILKVGDVNKSTIYEIWHGEGYKKLREMAKNGTLYNIPLCKGCEIRGI